MRVLVTGDRNWRDALSVHSSLMEVFLNAGDSAEALSWAVGDPGFITVVHGDAKGADSIADVCAQLIGMEVERYPAKWDEYGRSAGPIRNREMLATGIDYWLGFHEDIENSKGTADMVLLLETAGIPGKLIEKGQVDNLGR